MKIIFRRRIYEFVKKTRVFRIKALYTVTEFRAIYCFETSPTSNKKMKYSSTDTQRVNHELRLYIVIVKKMYGQRQKHLSNAFDTQQFISPAELATSFPAGFLFNSTFPFEKPSKFTKQLFFETTPQNHVMRKRSTGQWEDYAIHTAVPLAENSALIKPRLWPH